MGLNDNEKKSMVLYYSYRKTEFKHINGEQLKNILMCLLELDEKGTITEEKDRLETIMKDPLSSTVFDVMRDKTARASEEWWRLYDNRQKHREAKKTAQAEDKPAAVKPSHEAPVPEKKVLGVNKGAYWLHGSDCETEEEEALLVDEIMNNENWREDEDLLADYKSGEFFKSVKVSNISKEISAYNVIAGYMKSFYDR